MIPILPSTKNSRLISYQRSSTTKSGITKITSLISNGSTVRRSNRSADVLNATLMTTAHAPAAMLQSLISTRITAQKDSFCVRSAPPHSHRKKIVFQSPTLWNARTAITLWFTRKTANTLLSTNVWIQNVLTTSTTSTRLIKRILKRTMARTNINSITSTGNSR